MIQPPFLQAGDTVSIVAPGRKLNEDVVMTASTQLKSWGLNVIFGKNLFSAKHSYLSGTDAERFEDLQQALNDSSVKAIICARGGYGSTRILDQLDFTSFIKNPKWVCGFSDITALHLKLQSLNIKSIHGTMPVLFSNPTSADSIKSLKRLLFGEGGGLQAEGFEHNRTGQNSGEVIGGNLSLVADSLGTSSEIKTDNRILIIEEVGEQFYHIDRMMVQLKRAGKLKNLRGLVVGHMTDLKENELPFGETIQQIVLEHTKEFSYPIAFNFPTGHENPNLAWVQGADAMLTVSNEKAELKF